MYLRTWQHQSNLRLNQRVLPLARPSANDIEFRNTMLADRLKHFDFDKYYTIHTSKYDDGFNLDSEGDC